MALDVLEVVSIIGINRPVDPGIIGQLGLILFFRGRLWGQWLSVLDDAAFDVRTMVLRALHGLLSINSLFPKLD